MLFKNAKTRAGVIAFQYSICIIMQIRGGGTGHGLPGELSGREKRLIIEHFLGVATPG